MQRISTSVLSVICVVVCFLYVMPIQAQWGRGEKGSGNVIEQQRDVSNFDGISVSSGMDLYITQGNTYSVMVRTDDNIQDNIKTDVSNGHLRVHIDGSINQVNTMQVHVTLPKLKELNSSGGSDVYGKGTLTIDKLAIHSSGGSDINLEVSGNRIEVHSSGGSDVNLAGKITYLDAHASGGSDIQAKKLIAESCTVRASGGADAYVHATREADLSASGASDIHIYGNPAQLRERTSSASDIHRMK